MLRKSPLRWKLTVSLFGMSPTLWGYAESFAEAVQLAQGIEWGFEAADPGPEPDLSRTVDLGAKTKRDLSQWLDRLTILTEEEAAKRELLSFDLGTGYYTAPSGKGKGLPMTLEIRCLANQERRELVRHRP